MTIETALYPNQLNATLPPQSDIVREGAGHLRLLKTVVKTTFPNLGGAWNATQTEANYIVGVTSPIQAQINSKGAIAGQTWTGAHVFSGSAAVPTLAQGTNTTGAASTAFVQAEWATRLPNYTAPITASSTELNHLVGVTSGVQSQINAKGAIAGQTWTGTHSFPNTTTVGPLTPAIQGYLSTATSDVQAQINSKAAKAGNTYTGVHNYTGATITVPTLAAGSSGNSAASVDYANALAFASSLPAQTGNAGKFVKTNGTTANWSSITFAELTAKPATVSGYGITDAVTTSGDQTIAGNKSFSGNLLVTGGALGYGVGAGGSVVQATSKITSVTLNKVCGQITMHNAALAANGAVRFIVNNTFIGGNDEVSVWLVNPVNQAVYDVAVVGLVPGIVAILLRNNASISYSDSVVLGFAVRKGATS